jgi:2-oxoglutarate dehydrogenase E1 component
MAVSTLDEMATGRFEPVLPDRDISGDVTRVVFTTGKVYYDLKAAREKTKTNVPIIRVEQLYPFPQPMIVDALRQFPNATDIVWAQDEPRNMGAWPYIHERISDLLSGNQKLRYVGRPVAAAPATGSHHRHEEQQAALVRDAIGG